MSGRDMFSPSGGSPRVFDRDGSKVHDQRRMNFGDIVDRFFPWAIAGLLAWLCVGQSALQTQMGVVIERTGAQAKAQDAERDDRRAADAYIQREIDELNKIREAGRVK